MKRHVIAGILTVGLGWGAQAADVDADLLPTVIPGTPTYWNWSGFYAGGQMGMSSATLDPGTAPSSMIAYILRQTTIENEAHVSQWTQLGQSTARSTSYGGFVGFNSQWEDVIIGLELNVNFGRMSISSADSIARQFLASDGYLYQVAVSSEAAATIKEYATLRGRAGYVMGRFLPYAMVGAAVGRADLATSVTVNLTGDDVTNTPARPSVALNQSMSERKNNTFIYGFSAGLGLDVGITENIFLRGEYEYVQFLATGYKVGINTGRVGVAVKF